MTDVVGWFESLCPIANPSGGEAAIRDHIAAALRGLGVGDQTVDRGGNLFVRVPGDAARDVIMLSAHMDSVPPCHGITTARDLKDGREIIRSEGRTILGADDKSGIATILEIVSRLAEGGFNGNHPLELLFSTREEIGLLGAKEFDMASSQAAYCYVLDGEGSLGDIFTAGPSQENLEIVCHGRASHAGIAPESGISAIGMAAAMIAQLPNGRIDERLTTNVGIIQGGSAMNVTAPEALLRAEARSHDDGRLAGLLDQYRQAARATEERFPGSRITVRTIRKYDHFAVPEDHPVVVRAASVFGRRGIASRVLPMNIGSDAHVLNHGGLPTVVLGMGFHYSHSLGEYIYCDELAQVCDAVLALVS